MIIEKVREFVTKSCEDDEVKHLERTLYWIKELKSCANEALKIAALTHDIDRCLKNEGCADDFKKVRHSPNSKYYMEHQKKSARIVSNFLENINADENLIKEVTFLIEHHESGGTPEADVLKDADSLSFFENNAYSILEKFAKLDKETVKEKFDFMFNRISSEKAKNIAKPMYEKLIKKLEEI
ncbi:MAG: DUF4202 family protein [Candidatus Aenigmarchaeota archaeon]|nr:DUF4202 family protein [Candidatus Aenigmarchaeota archaeon]